MSKRKFGLKSLFSPKTIEKTTRSPAVEDAHFSDSEGDDHFDPSAVNRPPPLDHRTESQLRRACAIIVENLKPSGYDIEDTRMKNDMYVDDISDQDASPEPFTPARAAAPLPTATTWLEDSSDRNSRVPYGHDVQDMNRKRRSGGATLAERESYHAMRRSEQRRISNALHTQQDNGSKLDVLSQVEAPIAPVPSARRMSRIDMVSPPVPAIPATMRPMPTKRQDSSSTTMSTQYDASTGLPSVSTSLTSANRTPSSTSKRTSDLEKINSQRAQPSAAAAGAWMKEEVDKRRNGQPNERDTKTVHFDTGVDDVEEERQHPYYQAPLNPPRQPPFSAPGNTNGYTEPLLRPTQRDASYSRPRPIIQINAFGKDEPEAQLPTPPVSPPITQTLSQERYAPPVRRIESHGDIRAPIESQWEQFPPSTASSNVTTETPALPSSNFEDRPTSPRAAAFDKTMANIRARMAATSLSSHPVNETGPPHLEDSPQLLQVKRGANWPVPPNRRSSLLSDKAPQMPPLPDKHQHDSTIIVKDFGRILVGTSRATRTLNKKPSAPTDIAAVGFDNFMNAVENGNSKEDSMPSAASSQYSSPPKSVELLRAASPPPVETPKSPTRTITFADAAAAPMSSTSTSSEDTSVDGSRSISQTIMEEGEQQNSPIHNGLNSPPLPPIPAFLQNRYPSNSNLSQFSDGGSSVTTTDYNPNRPFHRNPNVSAMDFLKSSNPERPATAQRNDSFFRVEPHPSANGNETRINGFANGARPNDEAPNGHFSPITSPAVTMTSKSPRSFSMTSRTASNISAINRPQPQMNGYPHYTAAAAPVSKSKFGLRSLLSRRRSRSFVGNQPGAWGNHSRYTLGMDEEGYDPLVCAAPVVAFGRGW